MNRLRLLRIAPFLLLPWIVGCAFDGKWSKLARAEAARSDPAGALTGRWEGKWVSDANGHSGKLRAIVTLLPQTATGNDQYRADFDARYMTIFRFTHGTKLIGQPCEKGAVHFEGSEDLGKMAGGVYTYNGAADGTKFESTYQSKHDHGRFVMTRPAVKKK